MNQLRLNQTGRNLTCGDLEISFVVIGLGVTGLKKTGFMHLLHLFERGGVILCLWKAFHWANVGSVDVFFTYGEFGFSFKGC